MTLFKSSRPKIALSSLRPEIEQMPYKTTVGQTLKTQLSGTYELIEKDYRPTQFLMQRPTNQLQI